MIYTFYSFKGGVGRSMALANIAEAFHQQGLRVVMIDWDLEAPGLEVYFYGQDSAALLTQARAHVGLIDMLGAYKDGFPAFADRRTPAVAAGAMPVEHDAATRKVIEEILRSASDLPDFLREIPSQVPNAAEPPQTLHDFLQQLYSKLGVANGDPEFAEPMRSSPLRPFVQCIHPPDPDKQNGLYLLSAGARSGDRLGPYASAVQDFDWSVFYGVFEGAEYFKWFRDCLNRVADVVLIDSRTGVTEMGGVCTRFMADAILAFCAPNFQNVDGVVNVMSGVNRDRVVEARGENRVVDVLVVPTRIDVSESGLLAQFKDRFGSVVEKRGVTGAESTAASDVVLPERVSGRDRSQWNLRIPYVPKYNYREQRVIGAGAAPADPVTQLLIDAYQKLVVYLAALAPEGSRIQAAMARELTREFPDKQAGVLICRTASTASTAGELRAWLGARGVKLREDLDIDRDVEFRASVDQARAIIVLLGSETAFPPALRELVRYGKRTGRSVHFLLSNAASTSLPPWMRAEPLLRDAERGTLLERLQSRGTVRRVPFMAPPLSGRLVRRGELLDRLAATLAQSSRIVISGPPGCGKSQLAALLCHDDAWDERYPGGVIWLEASDLRGTANVYQLMASALFGDEAVSTDPLENRSMVMRRLGEARTLLVLDNVRLYDGDDGLPHLLELIDLPKRGACIITTRDATLAAKIGATPVAVGSLSAAESVELLQLALPGLPPSDGRLEGIASALGHSPLALSLAAESASRFQNVDEAVQRLKADIEPNGVVSFDVPGTTDRSRSVAVTIRYGLARLSADERKRLASLVALENPFSLESVQQAWTGSVESIEYQLTWFTREGLVVAQPGKRFALDPLVAEYLRAGREAIATATARAVPSSGDREHNVDVRRAEALLADEKEPPLADLRALASQLKNQGYFDLAEQLFARGQKIPGLDRETAVKLAQGRALCTYKDQDRPSDRRFEDALAILNEADDGSISTNQETLGLAGAIFKNRWLLTGQTSYLERSLAYYRRAFEQGPDGDDGYTGINTAYILDVLAAEEVKSARELRPKETGADARRAEARRIREEVLRVVVPKAEAAAVPSWWMLVTIVEACFGLGRFSEAQTWLRRALALGVNAWELESTARQLARIAALQREAGTPRPDEAVAAEETMQLLVGNDVNALASIDAGKVGLALSGGGFRASLFHIGVLARLAELDVLRHVEVLSCVSGGSIVGAHYYLEVKQLLESHEDAEITAQHYVDIVKRVEKDFLGGVQRNVRTRVALSPLASLKTAFIPNYTRTERVGELYESEIFSRIDGVKPPLYLNKLFIKPKGAPTDFAPKTDNWRRSAKVPMLVLNATTLNTGHNWQFTASWMGESPAAISNEIDANDLLRRLYYWQAPPERRDVRLGSAVAASSCVPGLFEPLTIPDLYPERTVQLVDGGVHDNQGVGGLLEQDCAVMLISDASGHLASQNAPPTEALDVLSRSNNILMARVREAEYREVDARRRSGVLKGTMFVHLKKDLDVAPVNWIGAPPVAGAPPITQTTDYGVQRDVQHALANVRTDLDSFSDTEAYALMLSGYRMTAVEIERSLPGLAKPKSSGRSGRVEDATNVSWRFLAVENAVRNERGHEAAHADLIKHLSAAKSRALKIWRLAPAFTIATLLLLVGGVAVAAPQLRLDWRRVWNIAGIAGHLVIVGAIAAVLVGLFLRWRQIPKSMTQLVVGTLLAIAGWFAAVLHLTLYDALYLANGRVRIQGESGPSGVLARRALAAVVPAVLAVALLVSIAAWQRVGVQKLRVQARAAQERGAPADALQLWNQVERAVPDDPEARTWRAYTYVRMGQAAEALHELTPFANTTDPAILRVRAAANQQAQNNRAAADDLDRLVTGNPRDAQLLRDRGYVRRLLGEYGGALDDYNRSLEIEPNVNADQDRAFVAWKLSSLQPKPTPPPQESASQTQRDAPQAASSPKPRVYIQWVPPSQTDVGLLQQRLQRGGFDVPRPEQVKEAPARNEVRFYADTDRAQAVKVVELLNDLGISAAVKQVSGKVRSGHFELWLANDSPGGYRKQ